MAELIHNKITISFPDGDGNGNPITPITEENIVSESMRVRQSICDGDSIRFGGCIASEFRIDLMDTEDRQFSQSLAGKWISVKIAQLYASDTVLYPRAYLSPSGTLYPGRVNQTNDFYVFSGFIESAKRSATDKNVRNIIAYDVFAKMYEWDATDYLMTILKDENSRVDLFTIYNKCLVNNGHYSIPIVSAGASERDNNLYKQISGSTKTVGSFEPQNMDWRDTPQKISYGELLRCVCEIVGAFGFIVPDEGKGKFEMRNLTPGTGFQYDFYESLVVEEYQASGYTKIELPVRLTTNREHKTQGFLLLSAEGTSNVPKTYDITQNVLAWRYLGSGQSGYVIDVDSYYNSIVGDCFALNGTGAKYTRPTPLKAKVEANLNIKPAAPVTIMVNRTNPDGSYVVENGVIQKEEVHSYVFTRTLTGIQALTDEIEMKGMM